jgi:hypothetical protein
LPFSLRIRFLLRIYRSFAFFGVYITVFAFSRYSFRAFRRLRFRFRVTVSAFFGVCVAVSALSFSYFSAIAFPLSRFNGLSEPLLLSAIPLRVRRLRGRGEPYIPPAENSA